jgi:hypothetical protein
VIPSLRRRPEIAFNLSGPTPVRAWFWFPKIPRGEAAHRAAGRAIRGDGGDYLPFPALLPRRASVHTQVRYASLRSFRGPPGCESGGDAARFPERGKSVVANAHITSGAGGLNRRIHYGATVYTFRPAVPSTVQSEYYYLLMGRRGPASVSGFVLAGGRSSRIGRAKALMAYGDHTLIEHIARLWGALYQTPFAASAASGKNRTARSAAALMKRGCLWDSFVMVWRVDAFLKLIRQALPQLSKRSNPFGHHCLQRPRERHRASFTPVFAPLAFLRMSYRCSLVSRPSGASNLMGAVSSSEERETAPNRQQRVRI